MADGLITIVHLFWSVRFQAMSRGKNWEVLNPGKVTLLFVVRLSKHDVCYISGRITDIYVVDEMKRCISIILYFFLFSGLLLWLILHECSVYAHYFSFFPVITTSHSTTLSSYLQVSYSDDESTHPLKRHFSAYYLYLFYSISSVYNMFLKITKN